MPDEDAALLQAREDLKKQLAAGEYQTLVDVILLGTGRLIEKITRRSKPLPKWLSAVFLIVITYALGFGVMLVAGDLPRFYELVESYGAFGAPVALLTSSLAIVSMLLINSYIHRFFALWYTVMLDATESIATLSDFRQWLRRVSNWRLHLLFAVVGGIMAGTYAISAMTALAGPLAGYGFILSFLLFSMFSAAFIYLLLCVLDLSLRLRRYELKLFAADPSASEAISRLSSLLSLGVYLVAAYGALLTFIVASSGGLLLALGPFLLVWLWLPIIAIFVLNQTSLSSIIRRVKWKTLNGIQAQVEALQAAGNDSSKETMDAINRLLDYHDRVKATRGSALDLRAGLNFLNSLLLPLLGFLLANLDRVLAWFKPPP